MGAGLRSEVALNPTSETEISSILFGVFKAAMIGERRGFLTLGWAWSNGRSVIDSKKIVKNEALQSAARWCAGLKPAKNRKMEGVAQRCCQD